MPMGWGMLLMATDRQVVRSNAFQTSETPSASSSKLSATLMCGSCASRLLNTHLGEWKAWQKKWSMSLKKCRGS